MMQLDAGVHVNSKRCGVASFIMPLQLIFKNMTTVPTKQLWSPSGHDMGSEPLQHRFRGWVSIALITYIDTCTSGVVSDNRKLPGRQKYNSVGKLLGTMFFFSSKYPHKILGESIDQPIAWIINRIFLSEVYSNAVEGQGSLGVPLSDLLLVHG